MICIILQIAGTELNVFGCRLIFHTSSNVVTDQNPGPTGNPTSSGSEKNDTGRSCRSVKNAPGSSRDRRPSSLHLP